MLVSYVYNFDFSGHIACPAKGGGTSFSLTTSFLLLFLRIIMSVYFDMLSINVSRQPADHGGFISIFFRVKSLQIN